MYHAAAFLLVVLCHQSPEAAAAALPAPGEGGGSGMPLSWPMLLAAAFAMITTLAWMMANRGTGFGFSATVTPEDAAPSSPPDSDVYDVPEGLTKLKELNGVIKAAIEALNAAVEHHNEKRAEAEELLGEIKKAQKKQKIKCVRTSCSFNPHPPVLRCTACPPECAPDAGAILLRRC